MPYSTKVLEAHNQSWYEQQLHMRLQDNTIAAPLQYLFFFFMPTDLSMLTDSKKH